VVSIALFELFTVLVSGLGHRVLVAVQRWATWVFGALNLVVGGFLVATISWSSVAAARPAPVGAMLAGWGDRRGTGSVGPTRRRTSRVTRPGGYAPARWWHPPPPARASRWCC